MNKKKKKKAASEQWLKVLWRNEKYITDYQRQQKARVEFFISLSLHTSQLHFINL
jgi:hypothetical protein